MTTIWASKDTWAHTPGIASAGHHVTGTYHAFDTDTMPPRPAQGRMTRWGPANALCKSPYDEVAHDVAEPPLWGNGGGPSKVCRRCWVLSGHDIEALNARDAEATTERERKRDADRRLHRYRLDRMSGRIVDVDTRDLLTFLGQYEIHETVEFVQEALKAIRRDREAGA